MKEDRIVQQAGNMVADGRITQEEADRLRAAQGTDEFERVIAAIRVRHAGAHLSAAVAGGEMTEQESLAYLGQLERGEHPKGLRARLRTHRSPRRH